MGFDYRPFAAVTLPLAHRTLAGGEHQLPAEPPAEDPAGLLLLALGLVVLLLGLRSLRGLRNRPHTPGRPPFRRRRRPRDPDHPPQH